MLSSLSRTLHMSTTETGAGRLARQAFPWALVMRPLLGLAQGIALHHLWVLNILQTVQQANAYGIAIGMLCVALVPAAICLAIPVLNPIRALLWALLLLAVFAGLAAYHVWLVSDTATILSGTVAYGLLPICFYALFIAQSLLLASVRTGRLRADYATYFDVAWSQAAQIGLGLFFAALLWGVVALGAGLFSIIGLGAFWRAVESRWFILPLITTGFALSVNVTDLRVPLLRTSRSLFLTLAAWLSPLLTVLTVAFLVTLPFTGLQPLWHTHRGGEYLVGAAFLHVLLINAVFGDGTPGTASSPLLRWSASAACVLLTPLVAIAAYGALARIGEYGFTPARIFLLADILVTGTYAVGYAASLLRSSMWLGGLQPTNIGAAWLVVALILLLWSPVLDPARIAVDDQVARLRSGRTPASQFDFAFMQRAGRYGRAALRDLQTRYAGPGAAQVRAKAMAAATAGQPLTSRYPAQPLSAGELAAQVAVYPAGDHLPESLIAQDWKNADYRVPMCLRFKGHSCDAVLLDIMNQGRPQVLFLPELRFQQGMLMAQDTAQDPWHVVAMVGQPIGCADVQAALRKGELTLTQPAIPNITVAGRMVEFAPLKAETCP
jgi:hypothetical protein